MNVRLTSPPVSTEAKANPDAGAEPGPHRPDGVWQTRRVVGPQREGEVDVIVGVPTEIKTEEYRVALTPAGARELTTHGHSVLVQEGAGLGSSISDAEYVETVPSWSPPLPRSSPGPTWW